MAHESHGLQMEDGRPSTGAHEVGCRARRGQQLLGVVTVCEEVFDAGEMLECSGSPTLGSRHADPDAIVFADSEQGDRSALVGQIASCVQGAKSGAVVERSITDAGHHHGIFGPGSFDHPAIDGEGHPHCSWQVRGDG